MKEATAFNYRSQEELEAIQVLGYRTVETILIRLDTLDYHRRRPRMTLVRNWSYAARVLLAAGLCTLVLHTQAFAKVTGSDIDDLIPTIIAAESSGDMWAVGDDGKARGLMQIQEATWEYFSDYSFEDAYDPLKNIQVGRMVLETIADGYGDRATKKLIIYTYNTGKYVKNEDELPRWTLKHPNLIYREFFNVEG